jgi:trehalose-phosphatase
VKVLNRKDYDALLVDLDGVITRTAAVHAAAWKQLFDEFLQKHASRTGQSFESFDIEHDYASYVDGLPRLKGIETFLQSRNLSLPYGTSEDDPEQDTVNGLGKRKNAYFLKAMETVGVELYEPAVDFVRKAKAKGFACAVVSSSKNCRVILEKVGLSDLFELRMDGLEIARLGLQGKPDPDMFLIAAKRLGVTPERAVVLEDAISGVEAGRKGGFGLVIGVNRIHQKGVLQAHGADWEVTDMGTVLLESTGPDKEDHHSDIPSALDHLDEMVHRITEKRPAVFLDYDGTLTPIVDRPEWASLSEKMKQTIDALARTCAVAIVSGRDRPDVEKLVGLDSVVYAGSHGFDIRGPADLRLQHESGLQTQPALEAAAHELDQQLGNIAGIKVERKAFAVTIHFRLVEESLVPEIREKVEQAAGKHPGLRITGGKKIFELRPDIEWDKGKAVLWLVEALHLKGTAVPIYIGDDETDEDAFAVLGEGGIGIVVTEERPVTQARYRLRDPEEVRKFLSELTAKLRTSVNH